MDTKQKTKRAGGWLLVIGALVGVVCLIRWAGSEWSEAIVQGFAALGGLGYWVYRSRPSVTLRLRMTEFIYLELVNVGNRVARQVQVKCEPPIPLPKLREEDQFGPVEHFGDMDRDQHYVFPLDHPGRHIANLLDTATFKVSHERTWGFGRRESTICFRGAGARRSIREDAPTTLGEIAKTAKNHGKELRKIREAVESVGRRLLPPADGGDDLDFKVCAACGWERFTYYGSGQYAEFWCANCGTKQNPECECGVTWCAHRPPPRQSVKKW